MKLTVLVDNNTTIDKNFFGEPGLSFYIEEENFKLLFDVGYSDIFLRNAYKMGIDLKTINYLALSHGHLDHTWGISHLLGVMDYYSLSCSTKPTLLAHPMALTPKLDNGEQIGFIYSKEVMSGCFDLKLTTEPVWLTEKLVYLGEIPRKNSFENKRSIGTVVKDGIEEPDYILDDTALAYKTDKGIIIITGCSHSGICNIIEYAKNVCCDNTVLDIVGGFHLLNPSDEQLKGTLEYLSALEPKEIHACHCTDLDSKITLAGVVKIKEIGVGAQLIYESSDF